MPGDIATFLGNIIAQVPLVALTVYLWINDRRDKQKQIEYLRQQNDEKAELMEKFTGSLDKLSLSLELIKDRLR